MSESSFILRLLLISLIKRINNKGESGSLCFRPNVTSKTSEILDETLIHAETLAYSDRKIVNILLLIFIFVEFSPESISYNCIKDLLVIDEGTKQLQFFIEYFLIKQCRTKHSQWYFSYL